MEYLAFQSSPVIVIATNTFINVPVIIQYETTPMLEVVNSQAAYPGTFTELSLTWSGWRGTFRAWQDSHAS